MSIVSRRLRKGHAVPGGATSSLSHQDPRIDQSLQFPSGHVARATRELAIEAVGDDLSIQHDRQTPA